MGRVVGVSAPSRYYEGRSLKRRRPRNHDERLFLSNVIVKIHTDEGITGIGKAACDGTESVEVVKVMIDRYMALRLIGEPYVLI